MVAQGGDLLGEVSEGRLASEKTSILELLPHKPHKMKKIIMMVPDERVALVEELVKAVADMEIVEVKELSGVEAFQRKPPMERFDYALKAIVEERNVIANKYDFAWLFTVIQEECLKGIKMFNSVKSFRQHLKEIGIKEVPSNSTISDKYCHQYGDFPDWKFTDCDLTETRRRINVAKRFVCLFTKGK